MPAFYAGLNNLTEIADQCVGRVLDLVGLRWGAVRRWGEDLEAVGEDTA